MSETTHVGPKHYADDETEATALAATWLVEHRPHASARTFPYSIRVHPDGDRYVATIHADWTPTPKKGAPK